LILFELDDASPETFEIFLREVVRAHEREKKSLATVIAFKSLLRGMSPQLREVVQKGGATLAKMDVHTRTSCSPVRGSG
jgi:hypothetical protein